MEVVSGFLGINCCVAFNVLLEVVCIVLPPVVCSEGVRMLLLSMVVVLDARAGKFVGERGIHGFVNQVYLQPSNKTTTRCI